MSYLISQMWLCLIITAIIAGIIGWLLRGNGKDKLQALDQQWRGQYNSVDNARRKYENEVEQLSPLKEKNDELALQASLQKKSFEHTVQHLKKQTNIESEKQTELLTQKNEELAVNLLQFDKKIAELEEEKETSKLHFEKMVADKEQVATYLSQFKEGNDAKVAELETKLHISKADFVSVEEELFALKGELHKEKHQISELKEGFNTREYTLKEQLNQKESLLSLAIADKNAAQKALAEMFAKVETTEKSFFSEVKDKFDDFKAGSNDSEETSDHENKISLDIKSMFAASGIRALAEKGKSKVLDGIDKIKK